MPGDTLSGILHMMYGIGYRNARYASAKDQALAHNPHIRHPDRIRAGDILRLTADVLTVKNIGMEPERDMASEAVLACRAKGYQVSAVKVDRDGNPHASLIRRVVFPPCTAGHRCVNKTA